MTTSIGGIRLERYCVNMEIWIFREVWLYPLSVDVHILLPMFKQRVKDCYLKKWNSDVNSMKPLLTYRAIRVNH
jgi:hypothetical protein